MKKRALLIAGGGTLGTYVEQELLAGGNSVDVICLEDKVSDNADLRYFREYATIEFLEKLLKNNYYDAIVNFLHFKTAEEYAPFHELLCANTDQLIVLSSYRVYGDLQHPVTETAPLLYDVIKDDEIFCKYETYANGKYKCENYIRNVSDKKNWTIVRPVISFAGPRFDLIMHSGQTVIQAAKNSEVLALPEYCKDLVAGLDWAGNSGKLIANLMFKEKCIGETYTISSGQNLKWSEIADFYAKTVGLRFEWLPLEEYLNTYPKKDAEFYDSVYSRLYYDRMYSRDIDCSKVLRDTGLSKEDFIPIKDALKIEIDKLGI